MFFKGLTANKALTSVNVADNQFSDENDDVLKAMKTCMLRNKTLGSYDINYNFIEETGILFLVDLLPQCEHILKLEIPPRADKEVLE